MTPQAEAQGLLPRLLPLLSARGPGRGSGRRLLAVAGPPASGKSTLAAALTAALTAAGHKAALVPMDGFHLDNRLLLARGLLARKGAPETFDVVGFVALVTRLITEPNVVFPLFDRARDLAVAGAGEITANVAIAVVEGNYLMSNEAPWSELAPMWHASLFLDLPVATLRARLIERWLDHGLSLPEATARTEANDLPNAVHVLAHRLPASLTLHPASRDVM